MHGTLRARARSGLASRRSLLVPWLAGLLAWRGATSLSELAQELAALEPRVLVRALGSSAAERETRALRPLGASLRAMVAEHTPPHATVYFVGSADPVETQRLWLGLSALLFPRVILQQDQGAPLPREAGAFVLAPRAQAAALGFASAPLAGDAWYGLWAVAGEAR